MVENTPTSPPPASQVQLSTKKPIKLEINCAIVAAATQRPGLPYGADFWEFFLPSQHFVCPFCVWVFWVFCVRRGFPFLLWPLGENCLHCILCWCMRIEKYLQFSKIHPEAAPDWSLSSFCHISQFRFSPRICIHICIWFFQSHTGPTFHTLAVRAKWRQLGVYAALIYVFFLFLVDRLTFENSQKCNIHCFREWISAEYCFRYKTLFEKYL